MSSFESLNVQNGKTIELMDHQEEALNSLARTRETASIALLYHIPMIKILFICHGDSSRQSANRCFVRLCAAYLCL